jgi:hypothetical protein
MIVVCISDWKIKKVEKRGGGGQQLFYKHCLLCVGQQVLFIFKVKMFSGSWKATLEKFLCWLASFQVLG